MRTRHMTLTAAAVVLVGAFVTTPVPTRADTYPRQPGMRITSYLCKLSAFATAGADGERLRRSLRGARGRCLSERTYLVVGAGAVARPGAGAVVTEP